MTAEPITTREQRKQIAFGTTSNFSFITGENPDHPDFFEEVSERGDGPPMHTHPWPTWELVLEGTLRVHVEGNETIANAGDVVYTAPNQVHAYVVESDRARVVGIGLSQGRFYRLQTGAAPILSAAGEPDMQRLAEHAASCDVNLVGPPMQAIGGEGL